MLKSETHLTLKCKCSTGEKAYEEDKKVVRVEKCELNEVRGKANLTAVTASRVLTTSGESGTPLCQTSHL